MAEMWFRDFRGSDRYIKLNKMDERKENRNDVEAFSSICGMKKRWDEQNVDAEDKTYKCGHD